MRPHHPTPYEYEHKSSRPHKHRRKRNPVLRALDMLLFAAVIPLPLLALILQLAGYALVPPLWLCAYAAVTQTLAGVLFLTLTAGGVGGFGKVGYFFTHTHGKRWMTTEEAKGNTCLFGFLMLVLGILLIFGTIKML